MPLLEAKSEVVVFPARSGLLIATIAVFVFATASVSVLCFPIEEDHDTNVPDNSYWQHVYADACNAPIPPKTGACLHRNIEGMFVRTTGHETCWYGTFYSDEDDWSINDGGMNISEVNVAGSGSLHGACYDYHYWSWEWYALWQDGDAEDQDGGFDYRTRSY